MGSLLIDQTDLASVRAIGDKIDSKVLMAPSTQRKLLECCNTERAQITLLWYIVVEREISVQWVIVDLKVVDSSRKIAIEYERARIRKVRGEAETNTTVEGEQLVREATAYLAQVDTEEGSLFSSPAEAPKAPLVSKGPTDLIFKSGDDA